MLFDRLRITQAEEVGRIWGNMMQRVYDLAGPTRSVSTRVVRNNAATQFRFLSRDQYLTWQRTCSS
ncbi:MAG: hypothetical protein AUF64_03035 [Chloroflexi bacterium 13_1_20CM_54_36]|nr:MAG: hypothetical protein AUF64_03035 [Chloroflexi bacterium 13_1_20CM_54_36]